MNELNRRINEICVLELTKTRTIYLFKTFIVRKRAFIFCEITKKLLKKNVFYDIILI